VFFLKKSPPPPPPQRRCCGLERSKRGKNPFQIETWIYPSSITLYAPHPLLCFAFFQIVTVSFLFITYASFAEPILTLEMVHM
jgi:hypothetical protein